MKKQNLTHSRFNSAEWYGDFRDIIIGGAGGISSWTALFLSRIGHRLYIYDADTVEEVNQGAQLYSKTDIGMMKVDALAKTISNLGGHPITAINKWYDEKNCMISPIMIAGFDNMKSRKFMFERWKSKEDKLLFIDARLSAEMFKIYAVTPNDIEQYNSELFTDEEADEAVCSFKSTSHVASACGEKITSIICNYITNAKIGESIREVPFITEYESSLLNLTTCMNINKTQTILV